MDKKSKTILVICIIVIVVALGIITSYAIIKENYKDKAEINTEVEYVYCKL